MAGRRSRAKSPLPVPFSEALEQMTPEQLRASLAQVLDLGAAATAGPRSRRRAPRSPDVRDLTIRVDLVDAEPEVWRRVQVPSVLTLEQVHGLLQALFGWTDSHLHRFALSESVWHADEVFVGQAELEEADGDEVALPDRTVRLDEVLSEPGDSLRYVYDYGDAWELLLTMEQPQQTPSSGGEHRSGRLSDAVRLLEGCGQAPPEDLGGVGVWNDDRTDAPFDRAGTEGALALWRSAQCLAPELLVLLGQVAGSSAERSLRGLLEAARLSEAPEAVSVEQAREVVQRYLWLLDKVGEGVTLTAAGWLPPSLVHEAMTQLWTPGSWIGKANREDITEPVRRLRATARRLGLIRVLKGRLLLTRAGTALRDDPVALWEHIAEHALGTPRSEIERLATLLRLLELAADAVSGEHDSPRLAEILTAAGWRDSRGGPLSGSSVAALTPQLDELLDCLRASRRQASTTGGLDALARRALRQP